MLYPGEDRLVLASSGEGATSEGEFWESINQACLNRLPVLFLIEDNGWAISVPVENQTPGGSISKLMAGFPDLLTIEVDGTDLISSYKAMSAAAAWCREGHGPALVHAHCIRPYSHSLSEDERTYKTKHERDEEALRDPLVTFPMFLVEEGVIEAAELEKIVREIDSEILEDTHRAMKAEPPDPGPRCCTFTRKRSTRLRLSSMPSRNRMASRRRWWILSTRRCGKRCAATSG